ncbi:MAG: protein TolQ [Gammaproteobacteria bacterium]
MTTDTTLWSYVANAGTVVKIVMLLLILASIISWTFILQRGLFLRAANTNSRRFEDQFWSGGDLNKLYLELVQRKDQLSGLASIFYAGFKEFTRLSQQTNITPEALLKGSQRAMRVAQAREVDQLERHLPFLATVGSTSPYVGLFGTVWGIMTAFHALGAVQQATIAMVAPGISEALIATAMGLFAAIPAVIAYNRYSAGAERLANHYETFQEEFAGILQREGHKR